jgi:hypothetical protein
MAPSLGSDRSVLSGGDLRFLFCNETLIRNAQLVILLISEFIQAALSEPEQEFGPAFSYWVLRSPNGPHRAHFVLKFYGCLEYYAQMQPRTYSTTEQAQAVEGL